MQGGARQVECAINGIGERAGNAALEEIVMALKVRGETLGFDSQVDPIHITRASRYVSAITGFPVQFNKAIVGKNAFAHESGIHQDGMLKNRETYEIMTPESVGQAPSSLVMGKHSGSHAFRAKLKDLGYELGQNALKEAFGRFKDLADRKKHVYDDDIIALVDDALARGSEKIRVAHLRVVAGTDGQSAELTLDVDGQERTAEATGDGPVDAVFNAIHKIVPHSAALRLFQVHAVTEGTDAQAQVSVRLEEDGRIATGQAADTDTLTASAKAYVNALNNLFARKEKSRPEAAIARRLDPVIPAKREARRAGTATSSALVAGPGLRSAEPGMTSLLRQPCCGSRGGSPGSPPTGGPAAGFPGQGRATPRTASFAGLRRGTPPRR